MALKVNQDTFRIIEVWVIAGSIYLAVCWLIALGLRRLRTAVPGGSVAMSPIVRWLPALTASLLTTVLLAALALLIATLAGIVAGLLLLHGPRPLRALIRLYVDLMTGRSDLVLLYACTSSRASSVPDSIPRPPPWLHSACSRPHT